MKALPTEVQAYHQTPVFTQDTVPPALCHRHRTKQGSWGKIWVISGQISYQILTDLPEEHTLTLDAPGIIEPQVPHQVSLLGPAEFYVEFYRETMEEVINTTSSTNTSSPSDYGKH